MQGICSLVAFTAAILFTGIAPAQHRAERDDLSIAFSGGYGQIEVGGPFAGAEFHHSRPLPSRINLFYPVANSIDLSTDYWQRDRSLPFRVAVTVDGHEYAVGHRSEPYVFTPYDVRFVTAEAGFETAFRYRFCEDLPAMVVELVIRNDTGRTNEFAVHTSLSLTLRTSHTFAWHADPSVRISDHLSTITAAFDGPGTDNAVVFLANAGELPIEASAVRPATDADHPSGPDAVFRYRKTLEPGATLRIVQIIGSERPAEADQTIAKALATWNESAERYEQRVRQAAERGAFNVADTSLARMYRWGRAIHESNRQFLAGAFVPMPCPVQYNFYFTHDMLVTNLGLVHTDTERVRADLLFLASLSGADSVLAHAYYWKDDRYLTEFSEADNWNHLWFILLTGSYLRRSGDLETVRQLFPLLRKSVALLLSHKGEDDLMYASRPDWWDIGHVYGARTYLTTLMIRALSEFSSIARSLDEPLESYQAFAPMAERMKDEMARRLWSETAGFLLNTLDGGETDDHFYAGSLLAGAFGYLDPQREQRQLDVSQRILLDENIGVRNVMPADFHLLTERYRFQEGEVGDPYVYINGGVWPQNNAWYALALINAGRMDEALTVASRYMTIDGVTASPNGQPALFEYRRANPELPDYGAIDKPFFLWAGGWYLHVLYRLAGARENAWNLYFSPDLPSAFDSLSYDMAIAGGISRVNWTGTGPFFSRIEADGRVMHSAVITAPATEFRLTRGTPEAPYLASATTFVENVSYDAARTELTVEVEGVPGQLVVLQFVAPPEMNRLHIADRLVAAEEPFDKAARFTYEHRMENARERLVFQFKL